MAFIFLFMERSPGVFGQVFLFVFQPFIYIAYWLLGKNKAAESAKTSYPAPTLTRRRLMQNALGVVPLVALGMSGKGVIDSQTGMTVRRLALVWPNLPSSLQGFKIGQISDTHLGPYFDLARLDTAIQLLAQEKPDLVVITGDLADDLTMLTPAIKRFNALAPSIPHGIYFCLGNHDYYHDINRVRAEITASRIILLNNSSKLIVPGEKPFYLLGVDYPWGIRLPTA